MKYYPHPQRSALKNYFPLANAIFSHALAPGALMIYAYLSYLQHAGASSRDATCRSVSRALGLSENTVRKHLRELERHELARIKGGVCVPLGWMRRENAKRFFSLPMEVFRFRLSPGAFAVYAYLLSRENRKTFDCVVSASKIAKATCMSRNTVRKCVGELEEQMLVSTERTSVITKKHLKYNGALRYRIVPVQTALDYRYERQLAELDLARERAHVRKQLEKQQAASAKQVHPVVSHKVDGLENCRFETRFEVKTTASKGGSRPCLMAGRGRIPPRSTGPQTPLWKPLSEAKTAYERSDPGKRFLPFRGDERLSRIKHGALTGAVNPTSARSAGRIEVVGSGVFLRKNQALCPLVYCKSRNQAILQGVLTPGKEKYEPKRERSAHPTG